MVDLPENVASMVQGLGYMDLPVPTTDAASTAGASESQVLGVPVHQPSPLQPVSLETKKENAPPLGAFLESNLHEDNYLDPSKPAY